MKRVSFPVLKGAWRVVRGPMVVIGVWGLVACGGGSGNGNGEDTELRAFVFGPDTAEEAAFLAADNITTFQAVSQIMKRVVALGESEQRTADLSDDFCAENGSAILNVPPFEPGVDALLEFSGCGDDALTGTVYFRVQDYEAEAPPPSPAPPPPFLTVVVDLDLTAAEEGLPSATRAKFASQAFRDAESVTFRYFEDEFESYWFMTEGEQTTKFGCFDLSIRETDEAVSLMGFRSVFVNAAKELFSVFNPAGERLRFEGGIVVGGDGLNFLSQAAVGRDRSGCAVVGAPEGITPGTSGMNLVPDPDVADGIILSGSIKTTWRAILAD